MKDRRLILFLFYLWAILLLKPVEISGEQLPIRSYTIADGLARDHVNRIVQDSRGFVWFCTSEGLSRYDGYSFVNYGTEQGLPNRAVNDLLETRAGMYWIATNGGMAIFIPSKIESQESTTNPRFRFVMLNQKEPALAVNKLIEDRSGSIWCATDNGLYRIRQVKGEWNPEFVELGSEAGTALIVRSLTLDSDDSLWIAADGLYRRDLAGHIIRYRTQEGLPSNVVAALLKDREGQFWAATNKGLCRFTIAPGESRLVVTRVYTTADGLLSDSIWSLLQTADGRLWIATSAGLNRSDTLASRGALSFRSYTTREGLKDNGITTMMEDRARNLWLGTDAGGAAQIVNSGFTSYTANDGLSSNRIAAILEDRDGNLRIVSANSESFLNRFDNGRFVPTITRLPSGASYSWGWYQVALQDRMGDWWLATADGLYRYGRNKNADPAMDQRPKSVYRKKDGLTADEVFRVFEDSHGDIWFSTLGNIDACFGRWERSSNSFHQYPGKQYGVPRSAPTAFAEDRNGDIWMGFYDGGLARYRAGSFTAFTQNALVSSGLIRGLFLDSKGRLWISSSQGGLFWTNDPRSDNPAFENLTVARGLSSNQVSCVIEDNDGRLYIGTGRGLDQLDSDTWQLKHYTASDGLADNFVNVSFRDRSGVLWFGTLRGLSRMLPTRLEQQPSMQTLIIGLRAGNGPYQVADVGVSEISGLELGSNENRIEASFVSIGLTPGETPHYQYMLEGADSDWSPSTQQHSVNYANLASGSYRFLVRSVNSGATRLQPASISFRVLQPVWFRWWFIAIGLLLAGAAVIALDRYRVSRTREVGAALAISQKLTSELITQRAELSVANRTLALEFAVTSILAEASTPAEAGSRILQAICESSGWDLGALWYVDQQASQLRCAEIWHGSKLIFAEFEALTRSSVFPPGVGLPGRVWSSSEPIWIERLAADSNFPRQAAAARDGLKSAFGFPILLESEVTGVSEFFSQEIRHRDDEFLALLSSIGSQIGQLLERRQAEEALRESEDRFRTLAETASDPIITIDEESNIVFVNTATQKVFGYQRDEMLGSELTMLMPDYLRELHRAGFRRYCDTGQKHLSWEAVELPGLHKSGREIPLEVSFGEFRTNGKHYFTGIARDITERKRAAEALQRSREERLRELETVRQRIATDLHDDIGSSLTQISILSEVVQSSISSTDTRAANPLSLIANASRELIDAMSDIVWAINPQKDHLSDLTQRMRRFAADIFTARNVQFHFKVPPGEHDLALGANIRREVFLVFKESVNNMVKHSGLTKAEIEFFMDENQFILTISDNGRGFDPDIESDGHGLMSMRERTHAIGGQLKVDSKTGKGTIITLTVPRENHAPTAAIPPT